MKIFNRNKKNEKKMKNKMEKETKKVTENEEEATKNRRIEVLLLIVDYLQKYGFDVPQLTDFTEEDVEKVCNIFKKSAENDNSEALYVMSKIYDREKNSEKSLEFLKKSAELGCADAEADLGELYINGTGVPKDEEKGYELIKKSAQGGSETDEHLLGMNCFKSDMGVSTYWHLISAQRQVKSEIFLSLKLCSQINNAEENTNVIKELNKLASEGFAPAQCELARLYHYGKFVEKDVNLSAKLYLNLAKNGVDYAITGLSRLLMDEDVEGFDEYDLLYWSGRSPYFESIKAKHDELNATLPDDFRKHIKDVAELEKEADGGNVESMATLGFCYERGYYTEKNAMTAKLLYTKAAENGHLGAKSRLE